MTLATFCTVGFRDFDEGVFVTLGAESVSITVESGTRVHYALTIPGVTTNVPGFDGKVPMFFGNPEDAFQPFKIPCILIQRSDMRPAFERAPWFGFRRGPATGANPLVVTDPGGIGPPISGYDSYAKIRDAVPMDLTYDVKVMARRQGIALRIFTSVLKHFRPPGFTLGVYDSDDNLRQYDAVEVNMSDESEIANVADRTISLGVSFTVHGEIDLSDEETSSYGGEGSGGDLIVAYPCIRYERFRG